MIELGLPYPPSLNHYWKMWRNRMVTSREGRKYRATVCGLLASQPGHRRRPLTGRIALRMDAFPPDRRRRDLDNLLKCTQDSLAHAGVYQDDSQIDVLLVVRGDPVPDGRVTVRLREMPLRRCPLCERVWPQERKEA